MDGGYNDVFNQRVPATATTGQNVTTRGDFLAGHGAQTFRQSTAQLLGQGISAFRATYRPYNKGLHVGSARQILPASSDSKAIV